MDKKTQRYLPASKHDADGVQEEDQQGPIEVEIVETDVSPTHLEEADKIIERLQAGKLTIREALMSRGSPKAVKEIVDAYVRRYSGIDKATTKLVRQARIHDALFSDDPKEALVGVKLSQEETKLEQEAADNTDMSDEMAEIREELRRRKRQRQREQSAEKRSDEND